VWEIDERNLQIVNLTHLHPESLEIWEKTTAQSTSDLLPKYQTSEISLKTSNLMLKHQKCQHCSTQLCSLLISDPLPAEAGCENS